MAPSVPPVVDVHAASRFDRIEEALDGFGVALAQVRWIVRELKRDTRRDKPAKVTLSTSESEFKGFIFSEAANSDFSDGGNDDVTGLEDNGGVVDDLGHENSPSVGAQDNACSNNTEPTEGVISYESCIRKASEALGDHDYAAADLWHRMALTCQENPSVDAQNVGSADPAGREAGGGFSVSGDYPHADARTYEKRGHGWSISTEGDLEPLERAGGSVIGDLLPEPSKINITVEFKSTALVDETSSHKDSPSVGAPNGAGVDNQKPTDENTGSAL